jgi:hypothetical protein
MTDMTPLDTHSLLIFPFLMIYDTRYDCAFVEFYIIISYLGFRFIFFLF